MRPSLFVGLTESDRIVFRCAYIPTFATHGQKFLAVIGPFQTRRAAELTAQRGTGNPHIQTVKDAERIGKDYQEDYNPKTHEWKF